ncbi:sigma-70 family RNA polymerase sigma factor [Streptomyces tsukubensis]|nr:sigma-70 family RNA polymerase sigma factor [Streptomyces tsukubensis]
MVNTGITRSTASTGITRITAITEPHDLISLISALRPLVAAEARAEATEAGAEPDDLEQAVWLRLLESPRAAAQPPADTAAWVRRAVRREVRAARRRGRREAGRAGKSGAEVAAEPKYPSLSADWLRTVRIAVGRLPGRCSRLVGALFSPDDLTYREIADELGMSQGSVGPERSRCLGCLRRMLTTEVANGEPWGKVRETPPADR